MTIVDQDPAVVERVTNRQDVLGVCGNGASLEVQKEAGVARAELFVSLTSEDAFNTAVVERVTNRQDVLGVCGNGASLEVQKEAGVARAELFVSLTSEDAFNILCCIMAKKNGAKHVIARVRNPVYFQQMLFLREELGLSMAINPEMEVADGCIMAKKNGAKHVIARVRNPVYFQQMLFLREELGLSMAINPEMEVADVVGRMLRFPSATKLELFAKGRLEMAEVTLPPVTPLDGVTLQELQTRFGVREELGLSMAINPEMEVADVVGRMLRFPSATKLELFAKGRLEMAEVTLPPVTPLDGVTLQELQTRFGAQVLVCAVCRGQQVIIPTGNFALRAGDHISISAGHADLNTFSSFPRVILPCGQGTTSASRQDMQI